MSESLSYNIVGNGKPLVLLHGFLENKNMWNFLAYSDINDLMLIMIDLPGHGNSPCYEKVHSMPFMAEKVKEVLDKENIFSYHLIGHSMGGYVSLAMAELYPNDLTSLGLFFSSPFPDSKKKKEIRDRAAVFAEENKSDFIRMGVRNLFNPHNLQNLQPQIESATEMAMKTPLCGITAALYGMRDRKDTSSVLAQKNYPILWIYGEYDTAVESDSVEKFLQKKDWVQDFRLPIGHMGQLESPDICSSIIHNFLK